MSSKPKQKGVIARRNLAAMSDIMRKGGAHRISNKAIRAKEKRKWKEDNGLA